MPWLFGLLLLIFTLLILGALFYAVMAEIGNHINFSGLFIKLFQKVKDLFHIIKLKIASSKVKK